MEEPKETEPVTGPPRTTGVIALTQKGRVRGAPIAHISSIERASITGLENDGIPPDTQIAVGPKTVVEFVNTAAEVLTHSGTVLKTFDIGTLFSGKAGQGSDPKIVYDASSGDYLASYISSFDGLHGPSVVELAVTKNPAGTWDIYTVHTEGVLQDQPKLGVSTDKITMGWNDNGDAGPEEYMVIQKAGIVADSSTVSAVIWGPDSSRLNVVPAVQLSSSRTAYATYHNYNSSSVGVLAFTGVPGISTTTFTERDFSVAGTSAPPGAQQPSLNGKASVLLDTGDDRLESTVWYKGDLWTAGNDVCEYKADTAPRACMRVINITTSPMALKRDVDITLVGGDVFYPAVTLDKHKDLWLAYSSSSTSQYASSEISEAPGGSLGSTIGGTIYHAGSGAIDYTSCTKPPSQRFGDYSGAAVDPARSDLGVWVATEFGLAGCQWGTQLGSFTP